MKIRMGFVSNSSSSSFIVAFPINKGFCEHCGRSDPDLFEELEKLSNDSYDTKVLSKERSVEYLTDIGCEEEQDQISKLINLICYPLKNWKIRALDLGYHDSAANYVFKNAKEKIILYSEDSNGFDWEAFKNLQEMKEE